MAIIGIKDIGFDGNLKGEIKACFSQNILENESGFTNCNAEIKRRLEYDEDKEMYTIIYTLRESGYLNVYVEDKLYVENDDKYIKDYIGDKGIDYFKVDSFDELDFSKLNKLLAIRYDCEFIDNLISEVRKKYPQIYTVKSFDYFCEMANREATKGNAVKFLAKMYGLELGEVLAIGDQNNDIEMVETAGIGVAMGNGTEEIKKAADYVTDTVQNDGFVKAIDKFVWGKNV